MANKTGLHKDPEVQIEQAINTTEGFIYKNRKILLTIFIIATLGAGVYFGYQHFVVAPKIAQANNDMFLAQQQFERDSMALALNGIEGVFMGFEQIASEYSGTPQGDIANHYAGICAMNLGDFQRALVFLQAFSPFSGSNAAGVIINAQNLGLQADCQLELGKTAEALALYKEAVRMSNSDATAPIYLQKIAIILYSQNDFAGSLAVFDRIKAEFPNSMQSRDADKHISLLKQKL